jgi:hypothetical protein
MFEVLLKPLEGEELEAWEKLRASMNAHLRANPPTLWDIKEPPVPNAFSNIMGDHMFHATDTYMAAVKAKLEEMKCTQ